MNTLTPNTNVNTNEVTESIQSNDTNVDCVQSEVLVKSQEDFYTLPKHIQKHFTLGEVNRSTIVNHLNNAIKVVRGDNLKTLTTLRENLDNCSKEVLYNSDNNLHTHNCNVAPLCCKCRLNINHINRAYLTSINETIEKNNLSLRLFRFEPILSENSIDESLQISNMLHSILNNLRYFLEADLADIITDKQIMWKLDIKAENNILKPILQIGILAQSDSNTDRIKILIEEILKSTLTNSSIPLILNDVSVGNEEIEKTIKFLSNTNTELTPINEYLRINENESVIGFMQFTEWLIHLSKLVSNSSFFGYGSFGNLLGNVDMKVVENETISQEQSDKFQFKFHKPSSDVLKGIKVE